MTGAPTFEGSAGTWEVVIGLEVHAQVTSQSKLFSGAATAFGAEPNTQVSLVDAAMPGMLPVVNEYCVEQAVRTGLGLKAKINLRSIFDRKNYFYPDLPQGYQISQFSDPIVGEGTIYLDMPDGSQRAIGIERLHLEQDAGKSLHDQSPTQTYVDLNRSGVALMEIVSKPDLRSAEEAGLYVRKVRTILRYLGTCDGNMDQGSMRCDVNISVRHPGDPLGTRAEIKNINSVRFVHQAIEYETRRQIEEIEGGGTVALETRRFDPSDGVTYPMRSKEEAHDYRYFPDPDLLPLEFTQGFVDNIRESLPELPDEKKARFETEYEISASNAGVLVAERAKGEYFEALVASASDKSGKPGSEIGQDCANILITDLFGILNKKGLSIEQSPIGHRSLAGLQALKLDGTISGRIAKDVFVGMLETGKQAADIVEEKGLRQVSDTGEIEVIIDKIIADSQNQLAGYKAGKENLFGYFVGQVMKATGGKANPQVVNELLKKKL